jgi:uncharacterized membrane protein
MTTSRLSIEAVGFQSPPSGDGYGYGFTSEVSRVDRYALTGIADGTDDEEISAVAVYAGEIAAGATVSIDFKTAVDRFGVALAATDVKMALVRNRKTDPANTGVIAVQPNAVNGWTALIGSTGATDRGRIVLRPLAGFVFWCFDSGAYAVANNNKVLDLVETGAAQAADVEAQFWITR